MLVGSHASTVEDFARLHSLDSEGEVAELMAAVSLFNYFDRYNDLLRIQPAQPASAEELAQLEAVTTA